MRRGSPRYGRSSAAGCPPRPPRWWRSAAARSAGSCRCCAPPGTTRPAWIRRRRTGRGTTRWSSNGTSRPVRPRPWWRARRCTTSPTSARCWAWPGRRWPAAARSWSWSGRGNDSTTRPPDGVSTGCPGPRPSTTGCGTGTTNGARPGCRGRATAGAGRRRRACTRARTSWPGWTHGSTGGLPATGPFSSPTWPGSPRPTSRPRSTPGRSSRTGSATSVAAPVSTGNAGCAGSRPPRAGAPVSTGAWPAVRVRPAASRRNRLPGNAPGSRRDPPVTSATRHPPAPAQDPLARVQRGPIQLYPEPKYQSSLENAVRRNLAGQRRRHARIRMERLAAGPRGRSRAAGRHDPGRDVFVAVAPAPAQNVPGMLAAPPVDHFRRHLELRAVLAPVFDQRAQVINELGGRVITHMGRGGQRFVIGGPARCDRPGQTRGGRTPPFSEIGVNSWNIRRAGARGKPRAGEAATAGGDFHRVDQRLRPGRLAVHPHHLGLLDRLVQVVALGAVPLRGEDHRCLTAGPPEHVQHVKPVEAVLDGVVHPGQVGDHHVVPQAAAERALHRGPVLGYPHRGVGQRLPQQRLDDLSQGSGDQEPWPVLHGPALTGPVVALLGRGQPVRHRASLAVRRRMRATRTWAAGRLGLVLPCCRPAPRPHAGPRTIAGPGHGQGGAGGRTTDRGRTRTAPPRHRRGGYRTCRIRRGRTASAPSHLLLVPVTLDGKQACADGQSGELPSPENSQRLSR